MTVTVGQLQLISFGNGPNTGSGDNPYLCFQKCNLVIQYCIDNPGGGGGGGGGGGSGGTVTSVGLSSSSLTVTPTLPITTSGTFTVDLPSTGITGTYASPSSVTFAKGLVTACSAGTGGSGSGGGGFTPTLTPTLSDATTAGINLANLNAALAAGNGIINCATAGVFYFNGTIIGQTNSTLVLGPNTIFRQAASTSKPMYMSQALVNVIAGAGTTVTLTQATGSAVSVAFTAHGFTVGQPILLYGSTVSGYNGVFYVVTVTDANNFVIYTDTYQATAAAGTIKCLLATQECNILGGTFDYNSANQTNVANSPNNSAIYTAGTADSIFEDVNCINAFRHSFHHQLSRNCTVRNCTQDVSGSGIYGPIYAFKGDGLGGVASVNSPFLNIQTNIPSTGNAFQFGIVGDIKNVLYTGISGAESGAAVNLIEVQPSDSETIDGLTLEQGGGVDTAGVAINVARGSGFTVGKIRRMRLNNFQTSSSGGNFTTFTFSAITFDQITIDGWSFTPGSTLNAAANALITFSGAATGNEFIINQAVVDGWTSNAGSPIGIFVNGANIKRWILRDCTVSGGTGTVHFLNFASTSNVGGSVTVQGGYYDASCNEIVYINAVPASGTYSVLLDGINNTGMNWAVRVNALTTVSVKVQGCDLGSTYVAGANVSATVEIKSAGNNTLTNAFQSIGGTPVWTLYGNDMPGDAGLLATTKGQYFTHASAVAGRNAANQQGPCIGVDGTHFYAIGTGTSGVNTLIV